MTVEVTLRQASAGATKVTFLPWCDGRAGGKVSEARAVRSANRKRDKPEGVTQTLKGADWQTLAFEMDNVKCPDGFELEFAGAADATIEVKSVCFKRSSYGGWWSHDSTLPAGRVWRAIAEVGNMAPLFINGREVPSASGMAVRPSFTFQGGEMFDCEALDVAALLKPGANAVALHSVRQGSAPYVYFSLTVVMESGEVLRVQSDGSWKFLGTLPLAAGPQVSAAGFADHEWTAAKGQQGATLNYKHATARPAYAGLITLENPQEPALFFKDRTLVELSVHLPPGLATPSLT